MARSWLTWLAQPTRMRVLVLGGSGLSADSGLPTFRGAGGLYSGSRNPF